MRISARADYAVRALLELAATDEEGPVQAQRNAKAQGIPHKFLEGILSDLRRGRLVTSQRGGNGGYRLAAPADTVTIADVVRVVDRRRDWQHQLSTRIVRENCEDGCQAVFVETLSAQGLGRTRLAKSVHDAGWARFVTMTTPAASRTS